MSGQVEQPLWYWLLPLSYLIHVAEEYWGGFVEWSVRTSGAGLSMNVFLAATAAGAVVCWLGISLSGRRRRQAWIPITMAAVFALNGIMHLVNSLAAGSISPGLISGLLLWVPLGAAVLKRSFRVHPRALLLKSVAGGIFFQAVISLAVRFS